MTRIPSVVSSRHPRRLPQRLVVLTAGIALSACAQGAGSAPTQSSSTAVPQARPVTAATGPATVAAHPARAAAARPPVLVHKSASCGCCGGWVEHMRRAGFTVQVNETDALEPIKKRLGVPLGKGSCHTAEVGGLVIEGHVPAADIERLLAMKDGSRGLVLPGMPLGSPGMEVPDGRVQRYTVERIQADGTTVPFATHGN